MTGWPRSARTATWPVRTTRCTSQPANAIGQALAQGRARPSADLDLIEINEAFAAVGIAVDARPRHRARRSSTSTAARSRSATRSACPAPGSCCPWRSSCAGAAAAPARRRCAAAAARATRCIADRCRAVRTGRRRADAVRPGVSRGRRRRWWRGPATGGRAVRVARLIIAGRERRAGAAARWRRRWRRYTGRAQVIGLTGSPGVGKSTTTTSWSGRCAGRGQRVGVLAVDPSSPFTGGAILGDRVRMQDHATDPGVFIRSMSSRGPPRRAGRGDARRRVRVLDAAGLRRRPGRDRRRRAGRGRGRLAWPTPRWCCSRRAWATRSRPPRPASWRSPTCSWSTRPTGTAPTQTVRDLQGMIALGGRRSEPGAWRPPIVSDGRGPRSGGSTSCWPRWTSTALAGAVRRGGAPPARPGGGGGGGDRGRRAAGPHRRPARDPRHSTRSPPRSSPALSTRTRPPTSLSTPSPRSARRATGLSCPAAATLLGEPEQSRRRSGGR